MWSEVELLCRAADVKEDMTQKTSELFSSGIYFSSDGCRHQSESMLLNWDQNQN